MNEQIIEVATGEVFSAGLISPDGKQFWFKGEIRKDGTPDRRVRCHHLVRWSALGSRAYQVGRYAPYEASKEPQATALRARIADLNRQLDAARDELFSVYAGPKPAEFVNP
jgi:hypothetical protein